MLRFYDERSLGICDVSKRRTHLPLSNLGVTAISHVFEQRKNKAQSPTFGAENAGTRIARECMKLQGI